MDSEEFQTLMRATLSKFEKAFIVFVSENDRGHIKVDRKDDFELSIDVNGIGQYRFFTFPGTEQLTMQSPVSGLYNYVFDTDNQFWKAVVQEHIIEDLVIREFIMHSKGLLKL